MSCARGPAARTAPGKPGQVFLPGLERRDLHIGLQADAHAPGQHPQSGIQTLTSRPVQRLGRVGQDVGMDEQAVPDTLSIDTREGDVAVQGSQGTGQQELRGLPLLLTQVRQEGNGRFPAGRNLILVVVGNRSGIGSIPVRLLPQALLGFAFGVLAKN